MPIGRSIVQRPIVLRAVRSVRLSRPITPSRCFHGTPLSHWLHRRCLCQRLTFSQHESLFYIPQPRDEVLSAQLPPRDVRGEPEAWLAVLRKALPSDLGVGTRYDTDRALEVATELSNLLLRARKDHGLDILAYLALAEGRWDEAARIIKAISGVYPGIAKVSVVDRLNTGIQWPQATLADMTFQKFRAELDKSRPLCAAETSVEAIACFDSDPHWFHRRICSRGVGQIWQSLGSMILTASSRSSVESRKIMSHVLAALAVFHHEGIISPKVYTFVATGDALALHQPPTLHLLSSKILEALANAAWYAHAAAMKAQHEAAGTRLPQYGVDRYRFLVDELGHEVWLELVLWSCLHGEWTSDGAAVLKQMADSSDWSLISWKHVAASITGGSLPSSADWSSLVVEMNYKRSMPRPEDRRRVERTISSEVVSAYVDGLANVIRVGVPTHGVPIREVLKHVKDLKALLDRHNMGLGYTTWDAVCVRLLESGGFNVEQDPQAVLDILALTQPFGRELESDNLKPTLADASTLAPTYVFDASAMALGVLHRAIDAYISQSNIEGALKAFKTLQVYTDLNKQRSLEAFFHDLREAVKQKSRWSESTFSSNLSAADYPSYYPQIPTTVLANLLEMLADAKMFRLGDWMIYTEAVDGRIIPQELYADPVMAAALIRYATVNGDKALLSNVIQAQAKVGKQGLSLPNGVLEALLQSQIKDRRWDSAENILNFLSQSEHQTWHPRILCDLAHEILVLQRGVTTLQQSSDPQSLAQATAIFRNLLQMRYGPPLHTVDEYDGFTVAHCIVGVLASIGKEWAEFCAPLSPRHGTQPLALHVRMFDTLLDGVVTAFGVEAGKQLWDTWCAKVEKRANLFANISPRPPSVADGYFDEDARVVLKDLPVGTWAFRGRIQPQLSTIRVLLRGILERRGSFATRGSSDPNGLGEVLEWALGALRTMTATEEEAEKELERLVTARQWQMRSDSGAGDSHGNGRNAL